MKSAPEEVRVDGIKVEISDYDHIELWGIATLQPDGRYKCYANIAGHLCIIEVTIHFKSEQN